MESQFKGTGFSAGHIEPTTTNTEHPLDAATEDESTTASDNADDSQPDNTEYVSSDESRAKESKRSTQHRVEESEASSKARNIPKKQAISVVFNYSKVNLTLSMENLLNRGFNYSILPLKKFERSVIWHEYFHDSESNVDFRKRIFKSNKCNLPKKYKSPEGLKPI